MRFRTRLMLVLLTVVVVSQLATGLAFLRATQQDALAKGTQRLEVGARVLDQLLERRGDQLHDNVAILADDFGFKSAVASQDRETLQSVLVNHGTRADADIVLLSDLDGQLLASSHHPSQTPMPFPELFETARQQGSAFSVVIADGQPYELVMLPVQAPNVIGWVGMGFLIDDAVVEEINALTGLEISVVNYTSDQTSTYLASSHSQKAAEPLSQFNNAAEAGAYSETSQMTPDDGYLTYASELYKDSRNQTFALIQLSRNELLAAYDDLQWQLVIIVALILLFTIAIAAWSARSISRPLVALADVARRIGQGERVTDVPAESSQSETGLLAGTLRSMQDDIAEREAILRHQSRHDLLTDLPNRISALEDINARIDDGHPFTLLRLAIKDFRNINDTFGYELGDHVLVTLAHRMKALTSPIQSAYRLASDEFLLLINQPDTTPNWRISELAALSTPIDLDNSSIGISLAAGEVSYPAHGAKAQLLLRRADIALDMARHHPDAHQRYAEGQDERHLRQLTLIHDLRDAVSNNQLWMAYQPKVATHDGEVCQFEALMRWRHPSLGFVPPDEFIGLAERSGNIRKLSQWMLEHITSQLQQWQQQGSRISVAVNLSASDVTDPDLPGQLAELLARHDLAADQLSLEVTESAVMQDINAAARTLDELSRLGVSIAIDDYGTGYSSLAQIKRLPVNELKIDKSFVLKLDSQEDDLTIVRSTIEMGHSLGLSIVAEGVENAASAALLNDLGCDYLQGYWIAKPMPSDQVIPWLKSTEIFTFTH
ncbi:EAL domain-containing protein [Halomonas janggokensis]|jgi:diguanylate cyclase (GGDEF)-like protein|uniref:EAL domain-containing protein n=1 Tax=Vreelandella janggokensis TaxID=370767 RepID=A0ABT4IT74_9GAMM|nr:EAL domain-containing protein [Halomonas janggokensis]MCZ0926675.1 EAL domain-containing protein [Halomonas janggokensis]MCZ0929213.1 EAL domain-containing protein [Halomonas janggokensis]